MTAPEILLLIGSVEGARPVIEGGVPYFAHDLRPAVPGNFPIARLVTRPFKCIVPLYPRPRTVGDFVPVLCCALCYLKCWLAQQDVSRQGGPMPPSPPRDLRGDLQLLPRQATWSPFSIASSQPPCAIIPRIQRKAPLQCDLVGVFR